jgi:RNA polymerase sigma factor (sigma-70 family)
VDITEIGPFGLNLVAKKARELVKGDFGLTWSDYEDLKQRMLADLAGRLGKFDPARSPRNAFIARLVNNTVAAIIEQQTGPARQLVRNTASLDSPLPESGGEGDLGAIVADRRLPPRETQDLLADLQRAIAVLPADLRELWDLRVSGLTLTEISARQQIPRTTLYPRWNRLCEHLRQAGLGDYFT